MLHTNLSVKNNIFKDLKQYIENLKTVDIQTDESVILTPEIEEVIGELNSIKDLVEEIETNLKSILKHEIEKRKGLKKIEGHIYNVALQTNSKTISKVPLPELFEEGSPYVMEKKEIKINEEELIKYQKEHKKQLPNGFFRQIYTQFIKITIIKK